ncbi:MAG TPA: potassium transporter Kup [Polyangiaceae bacterium]
MNDAETSPEPPPSRTPDKNDLSLSLFLVTLGVVYGDIGTSPLYAVRECFYGEHAVAATRANVLGVLSLIFWSLTLVVSIKYLMYVMRADNRGEGGVLALMALAASTSRGRGATGATALLGLFGAALLYGDGMITPAISVLSAVEGLGVAAPRLDHFVVPITIAILIALFAFQKRGTAGVGVVFGPVTLAWFLVLAALGVHQIADNPAVLVGLSPHFGVSFLLENRAHGFLVLGAVFLVVTGGEALYADMGHFGLRPIRATWFAIVLPALLLNYFGQGALLLSNPEAASNPFYRMAPDWAVAPLIVLSTAATIIASQAVISGAFSLTRQASMLGYWPRVRIQHTSAREIGQIYVPSINWVLMAASIGLVLGFGSSSNLAAAYGIAVSTTMVITTLLAFVVARRCWGWGTPAALSLTLAFLVLDLAFFGANAVKIMQGGWFPILVAGLIFLLMTTWRKGRMLLGERIRSELVPLDDFFELMRIERPARVPGAAVFLVSNPEGTPPALLHNFHHNRVVHEHVLLLTFVTEEVARVRPDERIEIDNLREGFVRMIVHYGFMETPDIPELLARRDTPVPPIEYITFFLGRETVLAQGRYGMSAWRERLFAFMARNSLNATAFYNVPADRVMEVGAHVEL